MNLLTLFQAELDMHGITWCKGCLLSNSHKRGFATPGTNVVHLDRKISTRSTLHRALHEVGHLVNDERGLLRWEKEQNANLYAERRMRELNVPVPRGEASRGRAYVRRMKRWGSAISKANEGSA